MEKHQYHQQVPVSSKQLYLDFIATQSRVVFHPDLHFDTAPFMPLILLRWKEIDENNSINDVSGSTKKLKACYYGSLL